MQSFSSLLFRTSIRSDQIIPQFSPSKISRVATGILKYAYETATAGTGFYSARSYKVAPSSALLLLSLVVRASTQPTYITTLPGLITIPGSATAEEANPIAVGDDDSTVISAYTNIAAPNNLDGLLSQFNTEGGLEGSARFGGPFNDTLRGLCSIPGQGYVGVGATNDWNGSIYHISAVKVSPGLDFEWGVVLSGNGVEGAWAAAAGPQGDVYLTGDSGSTGGAGAQDLFAVKILSNGTVGWAWLYGGPGQDWGWAITTSKDGHPVAGGHTNNFGVSGADFFVVKLHKDTGALIFAKTFGSSLDQYVRGIARTNTGRLVAAGWSGSIPSANRDVLVATWEDNGTLHSAYLFGSLADDAASAIAPLASGEVVVAWNTKGFSALHDEMALTEMDENMTVVRSIRSLSTVATRVLGIGIGSNQTIKLSGYTNSSGTLDLMTASLKQDWEMYNCSQFGSITPNITNVTSTFTSGSPSVSSFSWTPNIQVWNNVTANNVSGSAEELCSPEPPPPPPATTGVVTTGVVTTGNPTTGVATTGLASPSESINASSTTGVSVSPSSSSTVRSPSSSTKESTASSSPAGSSGLAGIIAGVVSAVALVCFAAIAAVFYIVRKRLRKDQTHPAVEMDGTQSTGSPAVSSSSPKSDRLSSKRDEAGRTRIGDKYDLVNKIDREEAGKLYEQTGVKIEFPDPTKKKTKALLGAGRFGKLRLAVVGGTQFVAVKKVKGDDEIAASEQEATLQMKLSGLPNVMPLLDSTKSKGSNGEEVLYQFMPIAGFGNGEALKSILKGETDIALKQKVLAHVAKGILTGLTGMHEKNIAHLDLKNANIVFDKKGEVFIIDFGCAVEVADVNKIEWGNGDIAYFSPGRLAFCRKAKNTVTKKDLLVKDSYSGLTNDLWALGLMLIEQMTGSLPLPRVNFDEKLERWDYDWMMSVLRDSLNKSKQAFPQVSDLIEQLLEADQKGNVTAAQFLIHPLFKDESTAFKNSKEREATFSRFKGNIPQTQAGNDGVKSGVHKKKAQDEEYAQSHYAAKGSQPDYRNKPVPPVYGHSPNVPQSGPSAPVYGHTPNAAPMPKAPKDEDGYAFRN